MSINVYKEHIFQMEKCSFLLDVIRSRVVVILETDVHSGSILDCATILKVSPAYCDFVLKMRAKYPNHDLEALCQEIYDRIWMHDHKNVARFQQFDEELLKEWYRVRAKEKQLRAGQIDRDKAIADFKHAYYMNYGVDIDVTEQSLEAKHEKNEDIPGVWCESTDWEHYICLLSKMIKAGDVSPQTAYKYIEDEEIDFDAFLRILNAVFEADGGEE